MHSAADAIKSLQNGLQQANKLTAVDAVCRLSSEGLFKRIDENRELLEQLQRDAPELLSKCFWIEGWLESQDIFLVDLANALGWSVSDRAKSNGYPRNWPGIRDVNRLYRQFEPAA